MAATSLNHVSVHAPNLEESKKFYVDFLGLEVIPTPTFDFPVVWLRVGDLQLHLFERDVPAPSSHHVGLTVDNFSEIYRHARSNGLMDPSPFFGSVWELPDGSVQMYLRDPAGNLVEIDWPDVTTLDEDVAAEITKLGDSWEQVGDAEDSTLFLATKESK